MKCPNCSSEDTEPITRQFCNGCHQEFIPFGRMIEGNATGAFATAKLQEQRQDKADADFERNENMTKMTDEEIASDIRRLAGPRYDVTGIVVNGSPRGDKRFLIWVETATSKTNAQIADELIFAFEKDSTADGGKELKAAIAGAFFALREKP